MKLLKPEYFEHLSFITNSSIRIGNYYGEKNVRSIEYICLGYIQRLRSYSKSIKILLEKEKDFVDVEVAIGIILRAQILDQITVLMLSDKIEKKSDDINVFLARILSDGLSHTARYLEDIKHQTFVKENDYDINKALLNLESKYNEILFRCELPEIEYRFDTKQKLKPFSAKDEAGELIYLNGMYDKYLWYSKYDHFGILFFEAFSSSTDSKIKYIENQIKEMTLTLTILIGILVGNNTVEGNEFIKQEYLLCTEYLKNSNLIKNAITN